MLCAAYLAAWSLDSRLEHRIGTCRVGKCLCVWDTASMVQMGKFWAVWSMLGVLGVSSPQFHPFHRKSHPERVTKLRDRLFLSTQNPSVSHSGSKGSGYPGSFITLVGWRNPHQRRGRARLPSPTKSDRTSKSLACRRGGRLHQGNKWWMDHGWKRKASVWNRCSSVWVKMMRCLIWWRSSKGARWCARETDTSHQQACSYCIYTVVTTRLSILLLPKRWRKYWRARALVEGARLWPRYGISFQGTVNRDHWNLYFENEWLPKLFWHQLPTYEERIR